MAWAKIDDGWWCHPKVMGLSAAARGVWTSAISWSCAQRRDVVPVHFLAMAGGSKDEANALVSAGLWVECDEGWRIHDWADYQDRSTSEKRADAGRKGGLASGKSRREEANARSKDEAKAEAGPSRPVPSLPDPSSSLISGDSPAPEAPVRSGDDELSDADGQAALRALRVLADQLARDQPGVESRSAYTAAIRARASEDGTLDDLRSLVVAGCSAGQASASLLRARLGGSRVAANAQRDAFDAARVAAQRREADTAAKRAEITAPSGADHQAGATVARAALTRRAAS